MMITEKDNSKYWTDIPGISETPGALNILETVRVARHLRTRRVLLPALQIWINIFFYAI